MERFQRTRLLLGEEGMKRLSSARIMIFGIGGVGGYAVEALARSGVKSFVLVDGDRVALSNINRQIIATEESVGRYKTEVMKERILSINPEAKVEERREFFTAENKESFDFAGCSYIIDAVDDVPAKVEIIARAKEAFVPVITSMGAGNKLDPTLFRVADIFRTSVCPLARVMRQRLKERGISHVKAVFSTEEPIKTGQSTVGSVAFVPPAAGLLLAGEVVKDLAFEETR